MDDVFALLMRVCFHQRIKKRQRERETRSLYSLQSPEFLHIQLSVCSILIGNAVMMRKKNSSSKNQFEMSETNAENDEKKNVVNG